MTRPITHRASLATATMLAALLAPAPAQADPSAAVTAMDATATRFHDGSRLVEARRLGAPTIDASGRRLTPIELRYPSRAEPITAAVDRTAIVKLTPAIGADLDQARATLAPLGARPLRALMPSIGLWLVEDTTGADGLDTAARLDSADGRRQGVLQITPNLYLRLERHEPFEPNDPLYGGQWFFDNLNMPEAWGLEMGDPSVSIVVVDTGCDLTHPDLVAKLDPGIDLVDDDDDPSYDLSHSGASHGTACAGVAAADTDNGEGIAGGCPECRLRCVRLLRDGSTPLADTVAAFDFALQVDAAVISNSWSYAGNIPAPQVVADAINNVYDNGRSGRGALVVFAAGNEDYELTGDELQGVRGVLCIGAINNFDDQTSFTNRGSSIDLVVYTGTLTTDIAGPEGSDPGDYDSSFGGTSSACPVAAGVGGLLASAAPELTSAQLVELLIDSARPAPYAVPDENGHDLVFGYGIVDPVAALRSALGLTDPEEQPDGGVGGSGGAGSGGAGGGETPLPVHTSPLQETGGCTLSRATLAPPAVGLLALFALGAGLRRRRRKI